MSGDLYFPAFAKVKEFLASLTAPSKPVLPSVAPAPNRRNSDSGSVLEPEEVSERVQKRLADGSVLDQLLLAEEKNEDRVEVKSMCTELGVCTPVRSTTQGGAHEQLMLANASSKHVTDGHVLDSLIQSVELSNVHEVELEVVVSTTS
eukprot:CAMPEP_0174228934 /NCGR_PEP_ID=MMETSP0417-20130205/36_1 /TAXON_ID=242541 /ORGANISM="Mayorella sp, Strain BSH-02190019" /LENGTH=147 /DNA_ID=CAMNT_0015306425 /DNA_START=29 /DNA_END=472 /DNA_ORIENTATION=+